MEKQSQDFPERSVRAFTAAQKLVMNPATEFLCAQPLQKAPEKTQSLTSSISTLTWPFQLRQRPLFLMPLAPFAGSMNRPSVAQTAA